jgi:hypothetical protein
MAAFSREAMDTTPPKPGRKFRKRVELATSKESPRIKMEKRKELADEDRPSEKMRKRQEEKDKTKTLGESLLEANAAVPEGRGRYGNILKGATAGAAAGATLGEALARLHQQKIQTGEPAKPRTTSEKAILGGEYDRKRKSKERGRSEPSYT